MKLLIGSIVTLIVFLSCITSKSVNPPKSFKKEFLQRINEARHKGCNCGTEYMPPAPPLVWNDDLEAAALNHAEDMSSRNYFSHSSRDGRTMSDRVINAGYTYKGFKAFAVGE